MKTSLTTGLVFSLCATFVAAQDTRAASRPDLGAEYDALEEAFGEAMRAYYAPYQDVKTPEEAEKIKLDPEKHPQKLFVAKFDALRAKAKGTEVGLKCLMWSLQGQAGPMGDVDALTALVEEGVKDYLSAPNFSDFVSSLNWLAEGMPADKFNALMTRIEKEAPAADAKAAAILARGARLFAAGSDADRAEGRKLYERIGKEFAGTRAAARAKGQLFELDHLQVGQTPPDMEAVDETGKQFRLYDYRGKVTVVDFWGFW